METNFLKSDKKYLCPSVDNEIKKMKLVATFEKVIIASLSEKSQFNLSEVDSEIFRKTIVAILQVFLVILIVMIG